MSKQFGTGSASREAEKRRDTRPSALVLRVHLPKLDSVAAAELDVGDSRVFFRVPGKYKLDLALPYEVFGDEGRAKFDKAARKLEVTLPVRPAPRAPAQAFTEPVETIADSAEARDEAVPSDAVAAGAGRRRGARRGVGGGGGGGGGGVRRAGRDRERAVARGARCAREERGEGS